MQIPDTNWNAINAGVLILSAMVTAATVYLRMFISGKMSSMETLIMTKIESKFSQKELVDLRLSEHERRLLRIETKMENIRVKKEYDETQ